MSVGRILPPLRSTGFALALSDFLALLGSVGIAGAVRALGGGHLPFWDYAGLLPVLFVFLLLYAVLGLYPGILLAPSAELKKLSLGTSVGFLFLSFVFFLGQHGIVFSRFVILAAWLCALALVPLFRHLARRFLRGRSWWGYPVIVFASSGEEDAALRQVCSRRESGLVFAASVTLPQGGAIRADGEFMRRVATLSDAYPGAVGCILADSLPPDAVQSLVVHVSAHFRRILVHLDAPWLNQATLRMADSPFGPVLAMRQNLLDPGRMALKRALDLAFCLIGAVPCLALVPLIAAWIRLDSKGPVFYAHKRVGRHGVPFFVYKFRTMKENAQEILADIMARDPELRDEWEKTQKLARDPRLTRVGVFLRHTSLDELPQLFNVVRGEMSLVGPRPIVEKEIARYGDEYGLYTRVRPGITGLWQVSGRNDLGYERRVELDRYYVYSWSVWLDIHIIIRTVPTMISGRGAY